MSEPTNAQIAAFLNDFASMHDKPDSASKDVACLLRLAARRLEAREEISEAKVKAVALALANLMRRRYDLESIAWDDPRLSEKDKQSCLEAAHAALKAAQEEP